MLGKYSSNKWIKRWLSGDFWAPRSVETKVKETKEYIWATFTEWKGRRWCGTIIHYWMPLLNAWVILHVLSDFAFPTTCKHLILSLSLLLLLILSYFKVEPIETQEDSESFNNPLLDKLACLQSWRGLSITYHGSEILLSELSQEVWIPLQILQHKIATLGNKKQGARNSVLYCQWKDPQIFGYM